MNRRSFITKLVSIIVIASLLYSSCLYAAGPCVKKPEESGCSKRLDELAKTSSFASSRFRGLIKPLAFIANLFDKEKKEIEHEDLVLIKSSLEGLTDWEEVEDVILAYNAEEKELFIYNGDVLIHVYKYKDDKTALSGVPVIYEEVEGLYVDKYEYNEADIEIIERIEGIIISGPEEDVELPPPPARLKSDRYLKFRFWVFLAFFVVLVSVCFIVAAAYFIVMFPYKTVRKWVSTRERYNEWIEKHLSWLLKIVSPLLRFLPSIQLELKDIVPKPMQSVWVWPVKYSAKDIYPGNILEEIRNRQWSEPKDIEWDRMMERFYEIIEEEGGIDLLRILNSTSIYLVEPGLDETNPFLMYDRKTRSYLYTYYVRGEEKLPKPRSSVLQFIYSARYWMKLKPVPESIPPGIYISRVFYESLSDNEPLAMMFLADRFLKYKKVPEDIANKVRRRIEERNKTGISFDHARTIIKNAYFLRKEENILREFGENPVREWFRGRILRGIRFMRNIYGLGHFLKAFMAEFFLITKNWLRTPFVYPIREGLHCGMPTPNYPLPEYGTYLWGIQKGFYYEAARIIAESCACVDNLSAGFIPRLGEQSRHYNMYLHDTRWKEQSSVVSGDLSQIGRITFAQSGDEEDMENYDSTELFDISGEIKFEEDDEWFSSDYPDTRLDWARYELERAINLYRMGERRLALQVLGCGLHSLQDLVAHDDFDVGPYGTRIHPPEMDEPDYDPDETGKLVKSSQRLRVKETESLSKFYLELAKKRFEEIDKELAQKHYEKRGYFVLTDKGKTSRYYTKGNKKGTVETIARDRWETDNVCFEHTEVKFNNGLGARQAGTIMYVARVLRMLTGINTTISVVDEYPIPGKAVAAAEPFGMMAFEAKHGAKIMVTVEGDVSLEFLNRALNDIIIKEVLECSLFDEKGIDPPDSEVIKNPAFYQDVLDKRKHILEEIGKLAMAIKDTEKEKEEEVLKRKFSIDTYINIRSAVRDGVIKEREMDMLVNFVYFYLARLDEIRKDVNARPLRFLDPKPPEDPKETLPNYTKEFMVFAILTGLIDNPDEWLDDIAVSLGKDYSLSPDRLHSLKMWSVIVEKIRQDCAMYHPSLLRELIVNFYNEQYGEYAARELGNVELALDQIAHALSVSSAGYLEDRLRGILLKLPQEKLKIYQEFLYYMNHQQLMATAVVVNGLFRADVPPPKIYELLQKGERLDYIALLGLGRSVASLEDEARFKVASDWREIEKHINGIVSVYEATTGKKPKKIRVLADLDMVVLAPDGYLGSNNWIDERIDETGDRYETFWEWGDHERRMLKNRFLRLVDPNIPKVIRRLRSKGVEVVGFTARKYHKDHERTREIIRQLGVEFSEIEAVGGVHYHGGIIYTYGLGPRKAGTLKKLNLGEEDCLTVVIDDTMENVTNIIQEVKLKDTYTILYRTPFLKELEARDAADYIELGDRAIEEWQFGRAQEYYFNAVECARKLGPEQRSSIYREIWKRIGILDKRGIDIKELVEFFIRFDNTKHDLYLAQKYIKDVYLGLLSQKPPITDRDQRRVISFNISEETDLEKLKRVLRVLRDIRRKKGGSKFITVLRTDSVDPKLDVNMARVELIEDIHYDLWYGPDNRFDLEEVLEEKYPDLKGIDQREIMNIDITEQLAPISKIVYERISELKKKDETEKIFTRISDISHLELAHINKKAWDKIKFLFKYKEGDPIEIHYRPDCDGVAAAAAEAKFLREYLNLGLNFRFNFIPAVSEEVILEVVIPAGNFVLTTEEFDSCVYSSGLLTTVLNSEVLEKIYGIVNASLYLENTGWLAALGIYGHGFNYGESADYRWSKYLSGYSSGWDVKGPRSARPLARGLKPRTSTVSDAPGMPGASSTVASGEERKKVKLEDIEGLARRITEVARIDIDCVYIDEAMRKIEMSPCPISQLSIQFESFARDLTTLATILPVVGRGAVDGAGERDAIEASL